MEFWGVEVKPGQSLKCEPGENKLIHLSQAALGVTKDKGSESIPLYVKVDSQKLVLGTLSSGSFPQISYDLVFEKEFELSHGSKNATVYFCGYKTDIPDDEGYPSDDEFPDFESEEDVQIGEKPNGLCTVGKPKVTEQVEKPKPKIKKEAAKPAAEKEDASDDSDDSEDSDNDSEDSDDDKEMIDAMGDSDDDDSDDDEDDDSSDDEDEETPTPKNKKNESGKKRPAESASKTPAPEKKAKLVSPAGQKTGGDGKKGGHVATPHPAKQAAKTPANSEKSKQQTPKAQTPKSAGSVSCGSCNKTFNSEKALESHSKAKHSAAK